MAQELKTVRLIWPVALPGSRTLRAEIDAEADGVRLTVEDDGSLLVQAGGETVRVPAVHLERCEYAGGGSSERVHWSPGGELPAKEGALLVFYRPVGDIELQLVEESGWTAFPPRLPEQPIFYPVTNEAYALEIARNWNVPAGNGVHVLRFRLREDDVRRWYPLRCVGARHHTELWVPAGELDDFNRALVGTIEVAV